MGGTIAAILFFFYRRDVKSYTELWRASTEAAQRQTDTMMTIVKENTAAFAQLTEVVKSLHRRLDKIERGDELTPQPEHGRRVRS